LQYNIIWNENILGASSVYVGATQYGVSQYYGRVFNNTVIITLTTGASFTVQVQNSSVGAIIQSSSNIIITNLLVGPQGPLGPSGTTGPTGSIIGPITPSGNVATVDAVYGNDGTATVGGTAYLTVGAAIAAVSSGQTIFINPGTYSLAAGITLPTGVSIRGMSTQTCVLQMLNVTANTTLLTMGTNTRVEDLTINLTSAGHYTLKGVVFGGTTSANAKIRTCVISVNNSTASSGGTSVVTGIEYSGTGTLGSASFSFNSIKGSTVNVYSNGGGNKRGMLVSNTNIVTTRDTNVYVAAPTTTSSTGSYVGVETADANDTGSIQLRTTTIGTVTPTTGQTYTASDILQTNPPTIANPTYLASAGIQVGPGTDLITKTAGSKGFSTYVYPTIIYYGLKGAITSATSGAYLWPGTQAISGGVFPDSTTPPAFFRIQQPVIISGLSIGLNVAPGGTNTVVFLIRYTPISTGVVTDTAFTITLTGTTVIGNYYNSSLSLNTGDKIHLYMTYTTGSGGNANAANDITAQIDLF
jgi:hypothetical protein